MRQALMMLAFLLLLNVACAVIFFLTCRILIVIGLDDPAAYLLAMIFAVMMALMLAWKSLTNPRAIRMFRC